MYIRYASFTELYTEQNVQEFMLTASFVLCLLFRLDTLQQSKARLELSNQTLKQQHQKELEGREEEVEQVRTAMNKKLKALSQQLEDMHEEKQAAVKVSEFAHVHHGIGKGSS